MWAAFRGASGRGGVGDTAPTASTKDSAFAALQEATQRHYLYLVAWLAQTNCRVPELS